MMGEYIGIIRTKILSWEGKMWKNNNITMKGVLRPTGKNNLWRYDETQFRRGQKIGSTIWVCSANELE
jgi:hypothetical protein